MICHWDECQQLYPTSDAKTTTKSRFGFTKSAFLAAMRRFATAGACRKTLALCRNSSSSKRFEQ
ncbi:hypothetical protein RMSM_06872 [Rhodopirellula maiorica SM1]|uniref:Uncharacterized protein n=1 Tax=Rhodopirellula maiorica SM1 TaxID=1265738 RepID=M5RQH4_9BACT|nr:hypothetical protein RMSM_06872 [Rhodopirellula maiorica SM1]